MKVHQAYDAWSSTYDDAHNLTRDLDADVMRKTFGRKQLGTVLELGCGTGKNTILLAKNASSVQAVDFSEGMIALAQKKVTARNVSFAVADVTKRWPRAAHSADLIVCNLVLEHVEKLPFVFSEAKRVLKPGGKFFLCEFHPFRQYQGKQATFEQKKGAVKVTAFVHHVSDFTGAAAKSGLTLERFDEWWHPEDKGKPPRLASFLFRKSRA